MKKQIYTLIAAVGLLASSCDSYFDTELYQQIPQENAYANVMDITNNLHGIYYMCGQYGFWDVTRLPSAIWLRTSASPIPVAATL